MSNRIIVNQSTSNGAKLLCQGVNDVFTGLEKLRRAKQIMDSAQFGSDNTSLAAEFGITTFPTGGSVNAQAADMIVVTANAITALEGGAIDELGRLDQG